jgi:hypothetical protein
MWKWLLGAVVILVLGKIGYDTYLYQRAGYGSAPELNEGDFLLSYKSGFRGVMRAIEDERSSRNYLSYSATNVPEWYKETWSICRVPTPEEVTSFEAQADAGPGSRVDAICEIDADGDVFIRGWIVSVPDL